MPLRTFDKRPAEVSPKVLPTWNHPGLSRCFGDGDAAVRREAAATLGVIGKGKSIAKAEAIESLVAALNRDDLDRAEEHAIVYAMIEIGNASAIQQAISTVAPTKTIR